MAKGGKNGINSRKPLLQKYWTKYLLGLWTQKSELASDVIVFKFHHNIIQLITLLYILITRNMSQSRHIIPSFVPYLIGFFRTGTNSSNKKNGVFESHF